MISKADPGFKRLSVVGLGYVGLPTAAIFAGRGLDVLGVDINAEIVELINQSKVHLVEPDLDKMVHDAVAPESSAPPPSPNPRTPLFLPCQRRSPMTANPISATCKPSPKASRGY